MSTCQISETPQSDTSSYPMPVNAALFVHCQRLELQSGAIKVIAVLAGVTLLVLRSAGVGGETTMWAAGPLVLLVLLDGVFRHYIRQVEKRPPLSFRPEDQEKCSSFRMASAKVVLEGLIGWTSLSVWPFYLTLAAIVGALSMWLVIPPASPKDSTPPAPNNPFAKGGYPGPSGMRQFPNNTGLPIMNQTRPIPQPKAPTPTAPPGAANAPKN